MLQIGLDFDNTIVSYDKLFYDCARERDLIPESILRRKEAVRAYLWTLPDGNTPWTELQGLVYGERMADAVPHTGIRQFIKFCRENNIDINIISHKTEYPALGSKVNLHTAARTWLTSQGLVGGAEGVLESQLYFESTREEKINRIRTTRRTLFIDDLIEFLLEPTFPDDVERWLFTPQGTAADQVHVIQNWSSALEEIKRRTSN